MCPTGASSLTLELTGTASYTIYRSLQQYRPREVPSAIDATTVSARQPEDTWYNLHGQRVAMPRRGLYIRNGRKILLR
jgi:hypothetical protein